MSDGMFDEIAEGLRALYDKMPHNLQTMDPSLISRLDAKARRLALAACYYYHEAMLFLCSHFIYDDTRDASIAGPRDGVLVPAGEVKSSRNSSKDGATGNTLFLRARAICADSIRAVFTVGTHTCSDEYLRDTAFIRVPILAVCILVAQLLTDPPSGPLRCSSSSRAVGPLLGLAAGLFGKLGSTAPFEELFHDVSELCLVAGQWMYRGT